MHSPTLDSHYFASSSSSTTFMKKIPSPTPQTTAGSDDQQPPSPIMAKPQPSCSNSKTDSIREPTQPAPEELRRKQRVLQETAEDAGEGAGTEERVVTGRERLKRHRVEVAGRVWIPDIWGQEKLLKDWIDCSAFDASMMNATIVSARAALAEEGRRAHSATLRIENSC